MNAEQFVKKDLGSNIAKGDNLQNIHYTANEWIDVMERYAQYKAENLPISGVSVSDSQIEELFPFEDGNNASPTRPAERIAAYNNRQFDRREGARRLIELLHSR